MSLADRPAAGLYVAAWGLGGFGLAALIVGFASGPPARGFLIMGGLVALILGLATAAGQQLVARRARPAEQYHGPAPLILFFLHVVLVNAVGVILFALGIPLGDSPVGFLVAAVLLLAGYLVVVWLFVVRAAPLDASRAALDIAIGGATMLGVALVAGIVGTLIAGLLGTEAPQVVPPAQTSFDVLLTALAAGILVPIGEEVFFRGYAVTAWLRDLGPRSALIRATVLFALVHVFNITASTFADGAKQALLEVAVIAPVGLALAWLYLRRGLLASIAGHAAYNLLLVLVIVLPQLVPAPGSGG